MLVSTDWLAANYDSCVVIDGTWHLPVLKRNARAEYLAKHLKNARFFDIDEIADKSTKLPHMLPPVKQFEEQVGALGITSSDHIVVYDSYGVGPACRTYWTFKVFGHQKVSVLDGGLPKWVAESRATFNNTPNFPKKEYCAKLNPNLVRTYQQVLQAIETDSEQIVDARPSMRFLGEDPEPRPGIRSGHIPGSKNVSFPSVVDPSTKTLLPKKALIDLFEHKGIDLNKPVLTSCGSGVTAAILYFALEHIGVRNLSLYDGSWAEYAANPSSTISLPGPLSE
ncbi:hypothetical protein HK102_011605 [Quaeritorhiza haematococci]|nr:hypothetical protein HK102_011605 [Quaeritorhiza haematococci]